MYVCVCWGCKECCNVQTRAQDRAIAALEVLHHERLSNIVRLCPTIITHVSRHNEPQGQTNSDCVMKMLTRNVHAAREPV